MGNTKKLIIIAIIAAAGLLAYYILSTPSENEKEAPVGGGGTGNPIGGAAGASAGGSVLTAGTGSAPSPNAGIASVGNDLKQNYLSKVVGADKNPKPTDVAFAAVVLPNIGYVKAYSYWKDLSNYIMIITESNGVAVFPGTTDFNTLKPLVDSAIAEFRNKRKGTAQLN